MTDLERRALLGDRQAQEECTRQGIVLPCPICGESVSVTGPEDWKPTFYDPDSGGDPYAFECECGLAFGTDCYDFKQSLARWNTRPAPPIGRCKDCANWYKQHCASGPCATEPTDTDFFCGNFEPKSQLKELAELQPLDGVGTKEEEGKNHVPGTAPERRSNEH